MNYIDCFLKVLLHLKDFFGGGDQYDDVALVPVCVSEQFFFFDWKKTNRSKAEAEAEGLT